MHLTTVRKAPLFIRAAPRPACFVVEASSPIPVRRRYEDRVTLDSGAADVLVRSKRRRVAGITSRRRGDRVGAKTSGRGQACSWSGREPRVPSGPGPYPFLSSV